MNFLSALLLLVAVDDPATTVPPDPAPVPTAAPEAVPQAPPPLPPSTAAETAPDPSIYKIHLGIDLPVIAAGASLGLMRVYFRDHWVRKSCPCDPASLNPIDRGTVGNNSHFASVAADVTVYSTLSVPLIADLLDLGVSRSWAEDLIVFIETINVDTGIQNAVNFIVARPRPLTYAGNTTFLNSGEGYLSFYAGHVATGFSALSAASFTLGRRHGQHVWPWIATFLVAGSIGVERVASGHHFPTDVATAAVMGTAIGITVPWLHTHKLSEPLTVAPSPVGQGLALMGRF